VRSRTAGPIVGVTMGMGNGLFGTGRRTPLSPKAAKVASFVSAAVFIVVGVFLIVVAESNAASISSIKGGRTTTGTIVSFQTGQNCGRGGCTSWWQPTIQFVTPSGADITFTGPKDQNQEDVGETVQVSYDPSNPTDAHDLSANVGSTALAIAFAGIFIAFALFSLLRGHRLFVGKNSLYAAHTAASTTSASPTNGPRQTDAVSPGMASPGYWVGHRYLHSRSGLVIAGVVFVGLVTWLVFAT